MDAFPDMMCGPMKSQQDGSVEKVVVAGGLIGTGTALSTTEIYDVTTDSWSKGTPLPVELLGAAVVPYKSTFLVIGGKSGATDRHRWGLESDKVYLYTTSGEWREMTHLKLSEAKSGVAAMLVPPSLFD